MKYIVLLVSSLTIGIIGTSQSTFIRTYDFGTVEDSYQMQYYKGRVFVNTATWCGVECSFISEIDGQGNILWRTVVPDIDIAQGTMLIINDTIVVTGNNDPYNTAFRLARYTMDGEKIGETIEIEHPTEKFTRMFQLTTQYFANKYVICGAGKQGDIHKSLLYVVNHVGILDTLLAIEPASHESDIWDSYIDSQGRLTTYHWIEEDDGDINFRKIIKFNENFATVWSYETEDDWLNNAVPRGCELHDERTIIAIGHPIDGYNLHSIRAINPDGTMDWQYDYQWYGSRTRGISGLKTLRNGDIMGCGRYSELAQTPKINDSPRLFRMSPEGELLWERTYFDIDTNDKESRRGVLLDFVELDNGDIMAVGNFRYEDNDMLIMRVDSNGCLDPENCHEVNIVDIITATQSVPYESRNLTIYPNPVPDILHIEFESSVYQLDIELLDTNGRIVTIGILTEGHGEINTSELPAGIYWVNLKQDEIVIAIGKCVKIE
jgi:hypothetical protein